jgi:hypothetical protein
LGSSLRILGNFRWWEIVMMNTSLLMYMMSMQRVTSPYRERISGGIGEIKDGTCREVSGSLGSSWESLGVLGRTREFPGVLRNSHSKVIPRSFWWGHKLKWS